MHTRTRQTYSLICSFISKDIQYKNHDMETCPTSVQECDSNVTYRFTWGSDARDGYSQANSHTRVIEAFRCPISLGLCMCWLQPCGDMIHRLIKVHHRCIHWALRTILGNGAVNIISTCASTYPPTRKTTNRHATWAVTHPIIPVHMGYETSPVPHMHGSVYDGNASCHWRKLTQWRVHHTHVHD